MSDISQDAGWWLASDRRWYPPESHPNYRRPRQDGPAQHSPTGLPAPPPPPAPPAPPATRDRAASLSRREEIVGVVAIVLMLVAGGLSFAPSGEVNYFASIPPRYFSAFPVSLLPFLVAFGMVVWFVILLAIRRACPYGWLTLGLILGIVATVVSNQHGVAVAAQHAPTYSAWGNALPAQWMLAMFVIAGIGSALLWLRGSADMRKVRYPAVSPIDQLGRE